MRVTQNMMSHNMLRNVFSSNEKLSKIQDQVTTGRKISRPSDDPVGAVRAMGYRSNLIEIDQFKRNINEGKNWMELSDSAVEQVTDQYHRVNELLVQANTDTYAPADLEAIANEIEKIRDQLGDLANTTIGGRHIFAGTSTKTPPFDTATGEWTNTNSETIKVEMGPRIFIGINVDGNQIFANPSTSDGIFGVLSNIVTDLKNGDNSNVNTYLGKITEQKEILLSNRAALGARINRMENIQARMDEQGYNVQDLLSNVEDADMAEVIMNLNNQENVHRAALGVGSRIIQPTLLDFLR